MYLVVKIIHVSCAAISILGFAVRGYLKISKHHVASGFTQKVLPHIIDTALCWRHTGVVRSHRLRVRRIIPREKISRRINSHKPEITSVRR
ncbi:MAG: SirB2 family protein [Gammaproteobacteria bacterium]|nr:SirB2 family protein [Gammaproteobacteria bacterium]